jgi:hypothetical protein
MRAIITAIIVVTALTAAALVTTSNAAYSSTLPPEGSTTPTDAVYVSNFRSFHSGDTSRYVVGEVTNGTADTAYAVEVEIRLYDATSTLLSSETVFAQASQIPPGGRAGFLWLTASPPADVARAEASVVGQSADPWHGYALATVLSAACEPTASGVRAVGQVRNDHAAALSSVEVSATFYDADGDVLDVSSLYLDSSPLQPGATASFVIDDYQLSGCDHVAVTAEGYTSSQ